MNAQIKAQIKEHALKEFPNEACGFVCVDFLGKVTVIPCENIAFNKKGRFTIDPKMHLLAEKTGHIAAFYHSHASEFFDEKNDHFSKEDLDTAYEACLPALLYVSPNDTWHYSRPTTYVPAPLLGRPFIWGVWDCYSLVKDYYKIHKNVDLGSYFAPDNADTHSDFGYEKFVTNEKFKEITLDELQKDDVIIFQIKSKFWNHSAVYLGDNEFLHQPINRISTKGFLDDRIQKYIVKIYRHVD